MEKPLVVGESESFTLHSNGQSANLPARSNPTVSPTGIPSIGTTVPHLAVSKLKSPALLAKSALSPLVLAALTLYEITLAGNTMPHNP
ncbi:MAG: hypothetical protein CBB71_05500 [Rhodopirellula sp. TMED11]|nr:MAG: hypothetical protein CBB71_05500 [Rhodopirellula sp. TMED11]